MKFSRQVVVWSVVLYFALGIPISLLHEAGHAYVCSASGFDYQIWVDATGGHMICFGRVQDSFVYNAMGGVFGLAGSVAIITAWLLLAKRHYAILAVGLAYSADQAAKIILEGLYASVYESGAIDGYITAMQVVSWIGFMLYFARVKEPAKIAASDI
ncbi:hypothetical protein Ngar_c04370 [Candidatus Nitrososphaera gargensis Ga9.2]|uniref:Peptidase M50 n=1 Tax=Nitrososphaera gargensis (strain Ga9.2) TaxID=1237085 RepID=K0ILV5_NITGG|nr:hypothetical protein [Candidatus Nitrososphaera gargensis]AFU57384.1 hypothetical protein Ngar_c04370 [Candidatus Nitrososphaera gargensis Ga9.2]